MKRTRLSDDVQRALANAARSPGWNSRRADVQRFEMGTCVLYVVPFRRWAYRRMERQAVLWQTDSVRA